MAQALLILSPAATLAWLGWSRRWVAEDAFIDLRVVQNLLAGYGPLFNAGERVEVYTNPLWVGLLAALAALLRPLSQGQMRLEWIAALAGLVCSTAGVLAAGRAAHRLACQEGRTGLALPLGGLAVVALPVSWDFATSGLETGISIGWTGVCFWSLQERAIWVPVLLGLGPLIRPDLAIFSAGFLLLHLIVLHEPATRRSDGWQVRRQVVRRLVAAGALPVTYQLFRMGYFGAMLPNTALAKEAGMARWDQGWQYLTDFAGTYWLWLPLGGLFAWWVVDLAVLGCRGWRRAAVLAVPVGCGLLHAAYVTRVGGDFMHGRMLLPSYFAMLLPVAVVAGPRWWHAALPGLLVVPWAIACALWLRPPYRGLGPQGVAGVGPQGIADERAFYVHLSGREHPVTLADYDRAPWAQDGHALRRLAERRRTLLPTNQSLSLSPDRPPPPEVPLGAWVEANVVATRINIGLTGYAAGPRVHLVDRLGLGDPIASRLRLERRGRPGHEKELPDDWVIARFGAPAAVAASGGARVTAGSASAVDPAGSGGFAGAAGVAVEPPGVAAARDALGCGALEELLQAVEAPLTPDRFSHNLKLAWRLSQFRLPADPLRARAELCPSTA